MAHNDEHLVATMLEVVAVVTDVNSIRRHFARILVHSAPQDAQALFHHFASDLCDGDSSMPHVLNEALLAIDNMMREMGRSLSHADYGFAVPDAGLDSDDAALAGDRRVRRRVIDRPRLGYVMSTAAAAVKRDELIGKFTHEQLAAYQTVMGSISGNPCLSNVFAVVSSAGCGKTVFANGLAATVLAQGKVAICVAASALAAMLLLGGCTAHSQFHIPIPAHDATTCLFSAAERNMIRRADVILWDECSMVHQDVADTVERSLSDLMQDHRNRPFGGKTVVYMGDFKQLLPVVRYGHGHHHTLHRCKWWQHVTIIKFTLNWRAVGNPSFAALLETIGSGEVAEVHIPASSIVHDVTSLIRDIYGDFSACHGHQILALTLETCRTVNAQCLQLLPGELQEQLAADTYVDCRDPDGFPHEYVESLEMHGAPPFNLGLKVGARYMCIKNVDLARGIVNGTMLELLCIGYRHVQVRVLTGPATGRVDILTSYVFTIASDASGLPFTVIRRQLPLISAYCLSVHKSQGQSLAMVGCIFESDPFTHGQVMNRMLMMIIDGDA